MNHVWDSTNQETVNSSFTPAEQARARYVIWNIVSVNKFFDTYFTGKW